MKNEDKPRFLEIMNGCASAYRQPIEKPVIAIFWETLVDFDVDAVSKAFNHHIRSNKFFPTPAEIIARIPGGKASKHIGADEAWTIALASFDERATVVWTAEIAQGREIAYQQITQGDSIGARMAFREAYNRLIADADAPIWTVSAGCDPGTRVAAVDKAKQLGRLPAHYALNKHLLPAPAAQTRRAQLTEDASSRCDDVGQALLSARHWLSRIKCDLGDGDNDTGIELRLEERNAFELHKQQALSSLSATAVLLHG